jgi:hypothetical protein
MHRKAPFRWDDWKKQSRKVAARPTTATGRAD